MLAAIILCGLGYAEGAKLSRTLGGWQVISWGFSALVTSDVANSIMEHAYFISACQYSRMDRPGLCFCL